MNFLKTFLAALLAFVVGTFVAGFFWMMLLIGIVGAFSMEQSVVVKPGSILKIDLSEAISDAPSRDPFGDIDFMNLSTRSRIPILRAVRAIETAKDDSRIKGIYLRLNGSGGIEGAALIEELREAIADFKQSGKFVVSYNETYSQGAYYLASVADKIYLQPEGGMDWSGLAFNVMFYKGLLDKLDLKAEVFRPTACQYKSAVEPFISDKMSPANREQMQAVADSFWGTISGAVAEARGIDVGVLKRITDNLEVVLPEEALKHGFVDSLLYEDQMDGIFAELGAEPKVDGGYEFISLGAYAQQVAADLKNISADQVAVVYADGEIVDGEGTENKIYGNAFAKTLAEVRADDKVKAVVVRVNSPGGSALASDVIWREMELLRAEKPVIVSMGSYAASGGYYISAPADAIICDKLTLTGSIGVFGMFINTQDALKNKLGITLDGVKSNTSAGMGQISPLTPLERASVMRGVDKVYTTFTSLVAEGRNLPLEKVLDIAGGRVWSGEDALEIGLIDGYGGIKTAIAVAVDKAGLGTDFRVKEVVEIPTGFAAFFTSLNVKAREFAMRSELGDLMIQYKQVQDLTRRNGLIMYSPYVLEIK